MPTLFLEIPDIPAHTDHEQRQREAIANKVMAEALWNSLRTPPKKKQ